MVPCHCLPFPQLSVCPLPAPPPDTLHALLSVRVTNTLVSSSDAFVASHCRRTLCGLSWSMRPTLTRAYLKKSTSGVCCPPLRPDIPIHSLACSLLAEILIGTYGEEPTVHETIHAIARRMQQADQTVLDPAPHTKLRLILLPLPYRFVSKHWCCYTGCCGTVHSLS